MAECQQCKCRRWSGVLHDGQNVMLLVRKLLLTGEMGREGAGRGVVRASGKMSKHEGLGKIPHD